MTTDSCIGVIGAGNWGTTLAKVLGENGKRTLLWARREELCREINETRQNSAYLPGFTLPESVEATHDLKHICQSASLLIAVVPSHTMRETARELGNHLNGEHVVVHATKGIEQGSFKRMSEVLREETCLRKIGVISGPNLAKELAARQPTGTLVASRYDEVFTRTHAALHNDYFRVYQGRDVVGAEIGGGFKNIIALAAGVAAGLGLGDNTKALLLTRGLSEMARFGVAMGAEVMTFGGMAGMGDLIATCSSPLSRNHQVGARLARGEKLEDIQRDMRMVAEGVKMAKAAHDFAKKKRIDLPIVAAVYHLLYEHHEVPLLLKELMSIPAGPEFAALTV
ncbi:MAG: NAD(P)-dependent glycerol-3-phosphate dehydrogenase [Polyangiaceae bacterium]|nr:NAD(P)-dependent glycerol-3-phosphate dehydrogenase [Polyangiaceae bacterium]MBK8998189.1 NAD(P)-dependent glycerol-3-phosphate dehydrogenase [Myxococcales bacterium]MCE7889671.1 NAD(P)-dependent glycerol-3-phosphate dehydrogenase [Sorangiineae bacterium PRO1]MCL4748947.1 NAD(P)-dependent glycerol-3-phosphate dehydrogenase [Myxococcales bacterium]